MGRGRGFPRGTPVPEAWVKSSLMVSAGTSFLTSAQAQHTAEPAILALFPSSHRSLTAQSPTALRQSCSEGWICAVGWNVHYRCKIVSCAHACQMFLVSSVPWAEWKVASAGLYLGVL